DRAATCTSGTDRDGTPRCGTTSSKRGTATLVVLQQLEEVAIGILDKRDGDRPAVELARCRHRFAAGGDGLVVQRLAVLSVDIDLPHRRPHVDGARSVKVLRKLQARSPNFSLEHDLVHTGDLRAALHGNSDHALPEGDGPVDVTHVDAVLPEAV